MRWYFWCWSSHCSRTVTNRRDWNLCRRPRPFGRRELLGFRAECDRATHDSARTADGPVLRSDSRRCGGPLQLKREREAGRQRRKLRIHPQGRQLGFSALRRGLTYCRRWARSCRDPPSPVGRDGSVPVRPCCIKDPNPARAYRLDGGRHLSSRPQRPPVACTPATILFRGWPPDLRRYHGPIHVPTTARC